MKTATFSFQKRLKEIGMFFQGTDPVHQTMNRIAAELEKANIPYAVVGGMAVNAHRHHRTTDDLDILLTAEGFAQFRQRFIGQSFDTIPGRARRFVDRGNAVTLDILVTGMFPGSGKPGPIAYPDPAAVRDRIDNIEVVNLATLVELKLAARRYQDFADVVSLIRIHQLEESFADGLHSSVRSDYLECLGAKHREDEWEARLLGADEVQPQSV